MDDVVDEALRAILKRFALDVGGIYEFEPSITDTIETIKAIRALFEHTSYIEDKVPERWKVQ